ncbi:MAG: 2,3-bisphosphoglycerate-dependent phosphoglycerate mutase [Solirubrobacteraceae bacterium]|nr:2,3-bisphosphoglycerate-dependent phosphoglycerate mutase [Solirubrobacteraceae bacterium]
MVVAYEQRQYSVPADATEIVLVRHGASAAAIPGERHEMLEGRGNPPLSETGIEQAEAVGERLAREPLAAIFTSTLQRTYQTAAPLARRTGFTPVQVADLAEVGLGEWDGGEFRIRAREGDALVMQAMREERWDVLPGAEPMDAFAERVRRGIDHIVATVGPGVSVAAFVHGGVIADLCRQATRSRPFAFLLNDNTNITRLVVHGDGSLLLRSFNDIGHLS